MPFLTKVFAFVKKYASFNLGKWFNIPLSVHWSATVFALLLLIFNPFYSLAFVTAMFFVIFHEFGHALAAKKLGYDCKSITMYCLGGIAMVQVPSDKPKDEFLITLAGPAVNFVFALLSLPFAIFFQNTFGLIFTFIFVINFMLFAFNLLPMFPMDGGRLLRSLLNFWWKNEHKSTLVAVRTGQYLGIFLGICSILIGNLMLFLIIIVMWLFSESELERVEASAAGKQTKYIKDLCSSFMRDEGISTEKIMEEVNKIEHPSIRRNISAVVNDVIAIKENETQPPK